MKHITIVTERRLGVVSEITESLAAAEINIETIQTELHDNSSVINLTVDRYDNALQVFQNIGMHAISEDAILLRLKDEPGALAKIARRFTDAGIGIRSIGLIKRDQPFAFVAISTERTAEALSLVEDVLVG